MFRTLRGSSISYFYFSAISVKCLIITSHRINDSLIRISIDLDVFENSLVSYFNVYTIYQNIMLIYYIVL